MNILILNFILSTAVDGKIIRRPSNRDTMIYNMARGFVAAGHSVTLLAAEEFRPTEPETNDFEVIYFKSRLKKIFKPHLLPLPKGLGRFLRNHADKYDMVLSVETFSIPTLIAATHCRKKLIIWQEMSYHQKLLHGIPSKIWYNVISRIFINGIRIAPQSQASQKFISKYQRNVSENIIGHGVDDTVFYPGDNPEDFFIVIAMLIKRKRVDEIIRKFARYLDNVPDKAHNYRLKIVGEGPEMDNLKSIAAKEGISGRVDFLGFMNHSGFAPLCRKSKAFLVDTCRDLNMVSVHESLANGTPVLMNTVPNTSKTIAEFQLGIAKDQWDWQDLDEMTERYDEFHANCIKHRDKFTNSGCAQRLVADFKAR